MLTIVGGNDLKFVSRVFFEEPLFQKTIASRSGKV
jgi:hypothetical protein